MGPDWAVLTAACHDGGGGDRWTTSSRTWACRAVPTRCWEDPPPSSEVSHPGRPTSQQEEACRLCHHQLNLAPARPTATRPLPTATKD